MSFIHGLLYGLGTVLLIGPVVFTLIEASIKRGFAGGFMVAIGIILSDIIYALICLWGLSAIINKYVSQEQMAWTGALVLVFMSVKYFIAKPELPAAQESIGAGKATGAILSGFLVNFVNPFVLMVWIAFVELGNEQYGDYAPLFIAGILAGIFATDVLKARFAPRLSKWLNVKRLKTLYRLLALIMLAFSLRLVLWSIS